jgi:hypothetical protein
MGVRSKFGKNQAKKETTDLNRGGEDGVAAMHFHLYVDPQNTRLINIIEAVPGVVGVRWDTRPRKKVTYVLYRPGQEPGERKRVGLAIKQAIRYAPRAARQDLTPAR